MFRNKVKSLFLRIKDGDIESFNLLYNAYKVKVFNFIFKSIQNKEDAEEILQDTFIKLWQSRKSINPDKISEGYIFTIARNNILNSFRKKIPTIDSIDHQLQEEPFHNQTEEYILYTDLSEYSQMVINKMPDKRKLIFSLSREKGYTNKEIAHELNISIKTVEVQMTKALKYLKKNIQSTIKPISIIILPILFF
jgi:RNA polymerase sigma-70 factor (ECF subfamily)